MTEVKPLSPCQLVGRMIDLHSAFRLGVDGYAMRSGYDAKEQLQELVADLLEDGSLMRWAQAQEDADLRARLESFA